MLDLCPEYKALYSQRQSVERAFSRLKGQRSLNHITTRGLRKVTLHCYLSLIAIQAIGTTHSSRNGDVNYHRGSLRRDVFHTMSPNVSVLLNTLG